MPKLGGSTGWAYIKANRRAQDWATVGVAALVHRDNGGIAGASIGLVNMGATPLRAKAAEDALAGGATLADAAAVVSDGTEPPADHAGSSEYRAHLARVVARRALEQALGARPSSVLEGAAAARPFLRLPRGSGRRAHPLRPSREAAWRPC